MVFVNPPRRETIGANVNGEAMLFRRILGAPLIAVLMEGIALGAGQGTGTNLRAAEATKIREMADRHADSGASLMTQTVINLFANDKGQMTADEIADTYEREYESAKSSPWRYVGVPGLGWLAAGLLLLLLTLRESLVTGIKWTISRLSEAIYGRFSGSALFRRTALRKYRKSIREFYSEQKLVFRPGKPLHMRKVFVPLGLTSGSQSNELDAVEASFRFRHLMITGVPGSGKSVLLKHLLLRYADGELDALLDRPMGVY